MTEMSTEEWAIRAYSILSVVNKFANFDKPTKDEVDLFLADAPYSIRATGVLHALKNLTEWANGPR